MIAESRAPAVLGVVWAGRLLLQLLIPVCYVRSAFTYLFVTLVLLQTFSRELMAVDFALNRVDITARYCVNKDRPMLHCNGKCYFAKKLRQQQERESKSAGPLKERLEMLPGTFGRLTPSAPSYRFRLAVGYPLAQQTSVLTRSPQGVFHPPQA
jgi:hypothetical protein